MQAFIFGVKYTKRRKRECQLLNFVCQLLNFVLGKSKMAIYMSRKEKIEKNQDFDLVSMFGAMVKSRILIDFRFYKATSCLAMFEDVWCYGEALCSVVDDNLCFIQFM